MMEEKTIFKKVINSNGVFSCDELDITVEEWKKVLQDSLVYNNYKLWLARFYQEVEHKATCKYMGEKYKCSSQTPNSVITKFGIAARKILNRFEVQEADGSQTYWVIPMKKGQTVSGAFEWTMRDELVKAMEELGMTNPEEFEKKASFTWIPFYTEMAEKLLKYKDNRDELVKIVYGMDRQFVNYIKDDAGNDYPDIDPFSVFAIFNRSPKEERRKEICKYFKNVLQLDSNIPEDFDSIPLMDPRLSVFVWKGDISTGTQPIWDLCETVFEKKFDNEKFSNHFNVVRNQKGIKWTLTMALYWIRPYEFMPLDSNSREYLQKIGINVFNEKELNGQNYLDLCELIKDKIANNEIKEKSIPEISNNAWLKEPQGDTQMAQENSLVKKYANLLKNTKNLILTGAPGTGKTYLAKTIAARLILDREINNFDKDLSEEEKKQVESQTGFVQFHPSYDYTDFVEGLRPTDKDGNVGFERRDGVFKKFCAKALKNFVDSRKSVEEVAKETILDKQFDDFINRFDDKNLSSDGDRTFSCKIYEDESGKYFACKYWSSDREYKITKDDILTKLEQNKPMGTFEKILYKEFNKFCNNQKNIEVNEEITEKISLKNFVFIIDEINRGEVAKIFGELFYCVDPGYRGKEGKINTQYQNLIKENNIFYSGFFIPENVYIIGTMNDIDRSVESMDFAFRRRFTWAEVKAEDTQYMLDTELDAVLADEAKRRMDNLNAAIWSWDENKKVSKGINVLNEVYHIGASYFLKLKNYGGDFESLWEYHLKGILQEYLRGSGNEAKIAELKAAYDKEEEN